MPTDPQDVLDKAVREAHDACPIPDSEECVDKIHPAIDRVVRIAWLVGQSDESHIALGISNQTGCGCDCCDAQYAALAKERDRLLRDIEKESKP